VIPSASAIRCHVTPARRAARTCRVSSFSKAPCFTFTPAMRFNNATSPTNDRLGTRTTPADLRTIKRRFSLEDILRPAAILTPTTTPALPRWQHPQDPRGASAERDPLRGTLHHETRSEATRRATSEARRQSSQKKLEPSGSALKPSQDPHTLAPSPPRRPVGVAIQHPIDGALIPPSRNPSRCWSNERPKARTRVP